PSLDLSLTLGAATLRYEQSTGRLTLTAKPWLDSLTLVPVPSAADLSVAFSRAVPRVLLSSAASALLEAVLGAGVNIAALDRLLEDPGSALVAADALGNGTSLDGAKITNLLQQIASTAGFPAGPGLSLPGNLQLTAAGTAPVQLQLSTTAPLGDVLDLQL